VKILVVHPEGNINYNANLLGLFEMLGEAGHELTYVAPRRSFDQELPFRFANVVLLDRPEAHGRFLFPRLAMFSHPWSRPDFAPWAGHDLVIGDDRGILAGAQIARHYAIPHALISYEIFFREETSAMYKAPEIEACRGLAFAICQDEVRARHLCAQNRITPEKVLRIPAAGRHFRSSEPKPRLLHGLFGLAERCRTVLHMGSLADWTYAAYLLQSTRHWPENWTLVLHERYGPSPATRELVREHATPGRVHISEARFANATDMSAFIQSADVGIALYRPDYRNPWVGRNIQHIGLSSGKIAAYLQHGVPVATHALGEISDLIVRYGAGQVFALERPFLPEEPSPARIAACRPLFERHLDVDRFGKNLVHAVALGGSGAATVQPQGA
jgi:glycosyltransferase involved in cell wall biosynthesis